MCILAFSASESSNLSTSSSLFSPLTLLRRRNASCMSPIVRAARNWALVRHASSHCAWFAHPAWRRPRGLLSLSGRPSLTLLASDGAASAGACRP
eukprot:CAMPEP_0195135140 /NCGR_PEP_ID=MMETSP0448-20130528/151946_1 /TAXON_ID=66468 /ORGANISM="Heterocapsa triquestra, Strain CCMP 448" /LENGTH=94 /DNA_ID=CAMNT_0040173263 /DNA_START=38 /DNA_END=319 /DNA_ORIENTATION=+